MIEYKIETWQDLRKLEKMKPRGFRKMLKLALQEAAIVWHRKFAAIHFTRQAYGKYRRGDAYKKIKRRGDPMVLTGSLKRHLLKRKSLRDVRGTSKKVTLRMRFGRPPAFTPEVLRRLVFAEMERRNISYEQAAKNVYSTSTYSAVVRKQFQEQMNVVTRSEAQEMRRIIKKRAEVELNKPRPKTRRRIA